MQCRACGATLPQGASNCPTCGTRVPSYGGAGSPGQYDPTVMAPPPGSVPPPGPSYGGAGSPGQYDPTVMASPPGSVPPPGPSYGGAGSPGQYDPTMMAPPPGSAPPPGPFISYAPPSSPYGVPGPQYPPPGYLPQQPPPYPPMPGQPFPTPGQRPFRSRTGLIIGIVAGAFLLSCIGCSMISSLMAHTGNNSGTATPATTQAPAATSTLSDVATVASTTQAGGSGQPGLPTAAATVAPTTPSGGSNPSIVPAAAAIITSVTTARSVNTVTAQPINPATTFQTNTTVYVAFTLSSQHDFTAAPGYVQVKFYGGTQLVDTRSLQVARAAPGGYFSVMYYVPITGSAALYWCTQANCSDAQLAQVATFTITN